MPRRDAIAGAIVLLFVIALDVSAASAAKRGAASACTGATLLAAADDGAGAVDAILCLVNRERTKRGRTAVRLNRQLSKSASAFSEDMARRKFFSHVSPGGLRLRDRVNRTGYLRNSRSNYIAETIAWGSGHYGTPAELVRSLMQSPGHKRVLLDGRFRDVGIGVASGAPVRGMPGDSATLTLDFGRR